MGVPVGEIQLHFAQLFQHLFVGVGHTIDAEMGTVPLGNRRFIVPTKFPYLRRNVFARE